jgi:hypothetical protein
VNAGPSRSTCQTCGSPLPTPAGPGRARRYCDRACQQAAYRARHPDTGDPHTRLADLLTAVTTCQAALARGDRLALAAAADATATTARALAQAARRHPTPPIVTPTRVTKPAPPSPATPAGPVTSTPTPVSRPARSGTPATPDTAGAPSNSPHPPGRPAPRQPPEDLGEGYQLQPPPDQQSTYWHLFLHGANIGRIERTTTATGRTHRWRAYSPTGLAITNAAGPNGVYRTKRDALVQVAAHHQTSTAHHTRTRRRLSH